MDSYQQGYQDGGRYVLEYVLNELGFEGLDESSIWEDFFEVDMGDKK
jgi:hypothetical protein